MAGLLNERFLAQLGDNLFFTGFLISKSALVPFALASLILNIFSLAIYAIAYLVWFLSSYVSHNNSSYRELPAYKQFQKHVIQYLFSSTIGVVAAILSVTAIFVPQIVIPAATLFLISNLCWTIGEYYRFSLRGVAKNYDINPKAQQAYFQYAIIATTVSAITLCSVILCAVFPPYALAISTLSIIVGGALGCFALIKWADSKVIDLKNPPKINNGSYHQVLTKTKPHLDINHSPKHFPSETCSPSPLFQPEPCSPTTINTSNSPDRVNDSFLPVG